MLLSEGIPPVYSRLVHRLRGLLKKLIRLHWYVGSEATEQVDPGLELQQPPAPINSSIVAVGCWYMVDESRRQKKNE